MIKRFLFIEDGSVDIDALEQYLADDSRIIPYRQGSTMPTIYEPREGINGLSEMSNLIEENKKLHKTLERLADTSNLTIEEMREIIVAYCGEYL